jgi:HEAT repeat protein
MKAIVSISLVLAAASATGLTAQTASVVAQPDVRAVRVVSTIPTIPLYFNHDQQETAASLFQQAMRELNRQNYERASELFERVIERYARTTQAGDAYYWQAWALHKMSGSDNLEDAMELLELQKRRHPNAGTRQQADILLVNIRGDLARRGDSDAAEQVARSANAASRQQCPSRDDEETRAAALNAVLQMDAENAMPLLKKVMAQRDACYAELRKKAVFLISQKRTAEREDVLLDAARNDPNAEVRGDAIFWLGQTNSDKALDAIESVLNSSNDREVQEKAIFALSQHRSPRAAQILRTWAESNSRPVQLREKAIFHLSQHRDPANSAFLRTLYPKLTNVSLKEQVLFALSQRRGEGNEKWLMDVAANESEPFEARKNAIFWAGQMREVSVADLVAVYDRTTNREMKEQLIFIYSQRREREAVDKLMDIAKNDRTKDLREKAIFWLGQSKDPRVLKFLQDLIIG